VRTLLALLSIVLASCATVDETYPTLMMTADTTELHGWMKTGGEWELHRSKKLDSYPVLSTVDGPPFVPIDELCVTLVNDTGQDRCLFEKYQARRVVLSGIRVKYDDLKIGSSLADQLLSRAYYEQEPVFNFCLRDDIFVVRKIELAR